MASVSAEELRERCVNDLGEEFGAAYYAISQDITWLHAKWAHYEQLYTRSPARLRVLNRAADHFFGFLQGMLLDDLLLQLARLTDPPKSVGKENLTLQMLPNLITDPTLKNIVKTRVTAALDACSVAREWRNRRLAHNDLALKVEASPTPLPKFTYQDIRTSLGAVREVLDPIEEKYWNSETKYEHVITGPGDGDALVYWINTGLKAQDRRHERLRQGKPLPEDLEAEEDV
jgi:hypothetical protein